MDKCAPIPSLSPRFHCETRMLLGTLCGRKDTHFPRIQQENAIPYETFYHYLSFSLYHDFNIYGFQYIVISI